MYLIIFNIMLTLGTKTAPKNLALETRLAEKYAELAKAKEVGAKLLLKGGDQDKSKVTPTHQSKREANGMIVIDPLKK